MEATVDPFPPPIATGSEEVTDLSAARVDQDLSGLPIEIRLELHAKRHCALVEEQQAIDYVHDALVQCVFARDKVKKRLAEQKTEWRKFEVKLKDLYDQWQALESESTVSPTTRTKLRLKLRNPRLSTEQSLAELFNERKAAEEAHQHAFWQGQEHQRCIAELEEQLANYEDEIAHYERQTNRHAEVTKELKTIYARVFAGHHPEYPDEMDLRERIDIVAARSVQFSQTLELERKALAHFPVMIDDLETAELRFKAASRETSSWDSSRHVRELEHGARRVVENARKRENAICNLMPTVSRYPFTLPAAADVRPGYGVVPQSRQCRHFCIDMLEFMRAQWTQAKSDTEEMEAGVVELNRQVRDMEVELEAMRCRILMNKAVELGFRDPLPEPAPRVGPRTETRESPPDFDFVDPDLEDGESVFPEAGTVGPRTESEAPPEYSKVAEVTGSCRRPLPQTPT